MVGVDAATDVLGNGKACATTAGDGCDDDVEDVGGADPPPSPNRAATFRLKPRREAGPEAPLMISDFESYEVATITTSD